MTTNAVTALTVALNHQNIKSNSLMILNITPFIYQHNWKDIVFPLQKKDWKKFEPDNESIVLNILFVPHNSQQIKHAYKSKHNVKCQNQVIPLVILTIIDGTKRHYLAVKILSTLFKGITSKIETYY